MALEEAEERYHARRHAFDPVQQTTTTEEDELREALPMKAFDHRQVPSRSRRNSAHQLTSVTSAYPAQSGRGSLVAHEESDFSSKVDSWQRKINLESGLEESAVFGRRPARQGRAQSVTSSVTSSSVRGGGELVIYDGEVRLRRRRRNVNFLVVILVRSIVELNVRRSWWLRSVTFLYE